jgi:hypothetical protein
VKTPVVPGISGRVFIAGILADGVLACPMGRAAVVHGSSPGLKLSKNTGFYGFYFFVPERRAFRGVLAPALSRGCGFYSRGRAPREKWIPIERIETGKTRQIRFGRVRNWSMGRRMPGPVGGAASGSTAPVHRRPVCWVGADLVRREQSGQVHEASPNLSSARAVQSHGVGRARRHHRRGLRS